MFIFQAFVNLELLIKLCYTVYVKRGFHLGIEPTYFHNYPETMKIGLVSSCIRPH